MEIERKKIEFSNFKKSIFRYKITILDNKIFISFFLSSFFQYLYVKIGNK